VKLTKSRLKQLIREELRDMKAEDIMAMNAEEFDAFTKKVYEPGNMGTLGKEAFDAFSNRNRGRNYKPRPIEFRVMLDPETYFSDQTDPADPEARTETLVNKHRKGGNPIMHLSAGTDIAIVLDPKRDRYDPEADHAYYALRPGTGPGRHNSLKEAIIDGRLLSRATKMGGGLHQSQNNKYTVNGNLYNKILMVENVSYPDTRASQWEDNVHKYPQRRALDLTKSMINPPKPAEEKPSPAADKKEVGLEEVKRIIREEIEKEIRESKLR